MEKVSIYDKRKELVQIIYKALLESSIKTKRIEGKNKIKSMWKHHYICFNLDDVGYKIIVTERYRTITSLEILFDKGKKPKTANLESIIKKLT